MSSIPASDIVSVNPGVVGTGGNPLALNGVVVSQNVLLPIGTVQTFYNANAVSAFFGPSSDEYAIAQVYFAGFDNSTVKPGTLMFAPFALAAVGGWLQSGYLGAMTLAQLQALSGVLTVTVDGVAFTSSAINLSTASSFAAAAGMIAAAFTGAGKPTCTWNAINSTFLISSSTTGATSSMTYATGTLSAGLLLTSATGALLSQGHIADTPATAMANVVANIQNWVDFMTVWEPVIADKVNFAVWTSSQNQRYAYIAWDTDAQAIVGGSTTCFGAVAAAAAYDGVVPVYNNKLLAAFVLGTVASINVGQKNGRITAAFKSQAGFTPTVTNSQIGQTLLANGYSFYGSYATANTQFNFFYNGQMSGRWKWLDSFVNQVYLNSQLQLAQLTLLTAMTSIPYNNDGYGLVYASMVDPIAASKTFGGIRSGVTLSAQQIAVVNQAAGRDISSPLFAQGYYLQVLDPGAQVRGLRGSPIINLWYTDGGAVQKLSTASVDIM